MGDFGNDVTGTVIAKKENPLAVQNLQAPQANPPALLATFDSAADLPRTDTVMVMVIPARPGHNDGMVRQ